MKVRFVLFRPGHRLIRCLLQLLIQEQRVDIPRVVSTGHHRLIWWLHFQSTQFSPINITEERVLHDVVSVNCRASQTFVGISL